MNGMQIWEVNGIAEINDGSRCSKALKDFKSRVAKASDDNDSI